MSPVIRISDLTYNRLEGQATGFDTPANVIERVLDYYENQHGIKTSRLNENYEDGEKVALNPDYPGDLHFTKIIKAEFGDVQLTKPKWNRLVYAANREALKRVRIFDLLEAMTDSNIVQGEKIDNGFRYIEDIDISIQSVDAKYAWRNALNLAKQLKVPIKVIFRWRNNKRSAHPNEKGQLSWEPR